MHTIENGVSIERLRELITYDPDTGQLTWKVDRIGGRGPKAGAKAGTKNGRGYLIIRIDRTRPPAHRCAWAIAHGYWPPKYIDHVNGVRDDNRLTNLRLADDEQNSRNRKCQARNAVAFKGVKATKNGTFLAQIRANGKLIALGTFRTPELANAAYREAAERFYGEFARS